MTLYIKTGCPYCAAVLKKIDDLGIKVEKKNISDEGVLDELTEKGGKKQTPFLVDDANNVSIYESADIIEYLENTCGSGEGSTSDDVKVAGVCELEE